MPVALSVPWELRLGVETLPKLIRSVENVSNHYGASRNLQLAKLAVTLTSKTKPGSASGIALKIPHGPIVGN